MMQSGNFVACKSVTVQKWSETAGNPCMFVVTLYVVKFGVASIRVQIPLGTNIFVPYSETQGVLVGVVYCLC